MLRWVSELPPWVTGMMAGLPALALAWAARRRDSSDKAREREVREDEAARARLTEREASYLRRLDAEIERLTKRLDEAEADRDRGWSLARFWHGEAHGLRHRLRNARAVRDAVLLRHEEAVPTGEGGDLLPPFEEPNGART